MKKIFIRFITLQMTRPIWVEPKTVFNCLLSNSGSKIRLTIDLILSPLLILLFSFGTPAEAANWSYRYSSIKNKCLNSKGKLGLNKFDPQIIKNSLLKNPDSNGSRVYSNADLECMDLSNIKLDAFYGFVYPILMNWNFKGAILSKTEINFAILVNADFIGAQSKELNLSGYAWGYLKTDSPSNLPSRCHPLKQSDLQINGVQGYERKIKAFSNMACI